MSVCEELQKKLSENGSYAETLREKILYCIGYLESDDENDDLYNLLTYMLYSEKVYPDEPLVPKYPKITFDFPTFDKKFNTKCKTCKYYHSDVLFRCTGCIYFTYNETSLDLYEKDGVNNATK